MDKRGDFAGRLKGVRRMMAQQGATALLVPSADAFQGEYVPASDRRLNWLTGFSGSMGTAVVTRRDVHLFVDGRYTLQAAKETDAGLVSVVPSGETPLKDWLARHLKRGDTLGVDPGLITDNGLRGIEDACRTAGASVVQLERNPIDEVWTDRPAPPVSDVVAYPLAFAGETSQAKRKRLTALLRKEKADALLIASPESLCWLLNVRASDVPYAPLLRAFAVLGKDGAVDLFLDAKRLRANLGRSVRLHPENHLIGHLQSLGARHLAVRCDPAQTPLLLAETLKFSGAKIVTGDDPCLNLRAVKNACEIEGARSAHRRDGAALVRFLSGLKPGLRECEAAHLADRERAKEALSQGPSFGTIAAFGANAAIVHYRAQKGRDAVLKAGGLFLLDSGGQYLDGTTDVTRTVFIGNSAPGAEMRRLFTLVLKGHIALASAVFPKGTTGGQLDALARQFLWRDGFDYDHGTGHGVGSYLSVHEGPARIAKSGGGTALQPGMILSIEPGYYRPGKFGIRIESLALVIEAPRAKGAERDMLAFEILTMVPIDKRLVAPGLLSKPERQWLNAYHQRVGSALKGKLDKTAQAWLSRAVRPL
jgi:Xaa-Pro aminopeptidase